ncbi:peptidoglycan-binding domain-containing protein [Actinokineospora inagensis]|uniref:peptidoglycan-binding domain-containing protein n=1 Tax=Actinokineospora inagensis TaxID=103730 RepID=UPI00040E0495|nr:peptidoglycan-binding domain-containing protein [Actinokineospora inagensis]
MVEQDKATPGGARVRGRRRALWLVVAVTLVFGGGALVVARFVKSPALVAAEAEPPASGPVTVAVERRVLRSTVTVRGDVAPARSTKITYPGAGTGGKPVVTRLPLRAGDEVRSGSVVAEVSGRPVLVLQGASPAYRDLAPDAYGDDVRQLQTALSGLGYSTKPDAAGVYGAGTKKAVAALYAKAGYQVATANPDEAAGLRVAERRVRDAKIVLGKAAPDAADDAKRAVRDAEEDLAALRDSTGAIVPIGEVAFIDALPARVTKVGAVVGDNATSALVIVSSGDLIVHGGLNRTDAALVRPGQHVDIASEVLGATVSGRVERIDTPQAANSDQSTSDQSGGGQAGNDQNTAPPGQMSVLVIPDSPLDPKFDGQDVRLTVESASTQGGGPGRPAGRGVGAGRRAVAGGADLGVR